MQNFKTAGYIRLSKEDKIKDESNSVTNQKLIINSYIEQNEDLEFVDFNIEQLDKKTLNKLIDMIYIIDKSNIKIEFKNI